MNRLVCYGTLCPGEVNHHILGLAGQGHWQPCTVRAQMGQISSYMGDVGPFKIITLDATAEPLSMQLLASDELAELWPAIDEFEGRAYKRVVCTAHTANGPVEAYIYAASGLPLEDD
jgi:gamma-glutamylcyclotransferase (GGCT)/AIG2-like uncharacterized protein YtfP